MLWLQDRQRREVRYLRLSVTDRCNLRCRYCTPSRMELLPREELLSYEEIVELVTLFVELGISRVRLTGGEPLTRRDLVELVRMIARTPGVSDLSMTTNATRLSCLAGELAKAGLRRVNVSIDTIDPGRFADITRGGDVTRVVRGMRAARDAGLVPVKMNTVLVRGLNDAGIGDLIRFARDEGFLPRFIELMPIGIHGHWDKGRFLGAGEVVSVLSSQGFVLEPAPAEAAPAGGGPARYWRVTPPEGGQSLLVGFIAALTHRFCEGCNRVRLSADGRLRECLSSGGRLSLRDMLRGGAPRQAMLAAIHGALYGKVDGHGFEAASPIGGQPASARMSRLGG